MPVLHTVLVLIQTFPLLYQTFYLFVCLSCGLAYQSTALVMSGHCLYFVGLVPKIGRHDIQKCFKYNHQTKPIRLIYMSHLVGKTSSVVSEQVQQKTTCTVTEADEISDLLYYPCSENKGADQLRS